MTEQQFPRIDAEYCLAEGGGTTRVGGEVKYALTMRRTRSSTPILLPVS